MRFDPLPLTSRLDSLNRTDANASSLSSWQVQSKSGDSFSFSLPAYSRIVSDGKFDEGLRESLAKCLGDFGIPWIDSPVSRHSPNSLRIATIGSDLAADVDQLSGSGAIQFRFFGQSHPESQPSQMTYWKPAMHAELHEIEQLAKKVTAVRGIFGDSLPVGAALIAQQKTVYEDTRYLIDSGFDFIELIPTAFYDLEEGCSVEFDNDAQACVMHATRARQDAKSHCKLWLNASCQRPKDWIEWLQRGIDACSLDGYLIRKRPQKVVSTSSFAGIQVKTSSKYDWIRDALGELKASLVDAFHFFER